MSERKEKIKEYKHIHYMTDEEKEMYDAWYNLGFRVIPISFAAPMIPTNLFANFFKRNQEGGDNQ